jgi:hypothetical protein
MKTFLKKYKLIIFLFFLVLVLIFIKIYFGQNKSNKKQNENGEKKNIPTITVTIPVSSLSDQEKNKLSDKLNREFYSIKDEKKVIEFLNSLSDDERDLLQDVGPNYGLKYILPYYSDTFIINKYLDANVLSVTVKGSDFKKSTNDVQKWIDENTEDPSQVVIVWEK